MADLHLDTDPRGDDAPPKCEACGADATFTSRTLEFSCTECDWSEQEPYDRTWDL